MAYVPINRLKRCSGWLGRNTNSLYLRDSSSHDLEGDEMMAGTYPHTTIPGVTSYFIRHAINGGEVRIAGHLMDGYHVSTNTIYDFNGCLWHECRSCFPRQTQTSKVNLDRTFAELREATTDKEMTLRSTGHSLTIIWECEWDSMPKFDPELSTFLTNLQIVPPLEPRDAFFGGRINAATLHHVVDQTQGEEIRYVDVTSLYSTVNKYDEYPLVTPPSSHTLRTKTSPSTLG